MPAPEISTVTVPRFVKLVADGETTWPGCAVTTVFHGSVTLAIEFDVAATA